MSKLNKLKEQNPDANISIVDYLQQIDPSKTNKYVGFLLKLLKKNLIINPTSFHNHILNVVSHHLGGDYDNNVVNILTEFDKHLKNNRIKNKDISTYNSLDDIKNEINLAKIIEFKNKKDVLTLYDDGEWLVIKPLSYESSVIYGYNTRWCTSAKHTSEQFYNYSRMGLLIYFINRKTNTKVALHRDNTLTFWDQIDRRIDSIESGIPPEIVRQILSHESNVKTNYELFSDDVKRSERRYDEIKEDTLVSLDEHYPLHQPTTTLEVNEYEEVGEPVLEPATRLNVWN